MLKKLALTLFLLISFQATLISQTHITGRVVDENKEPLPNINVLVYPHDRNVLIAFGISNREGRFNIRVTHDVDSLKIKVTSLHYRNDSIIVANRSQEVVFELEPEVKDLEEFVVRASPIEQRGDTISYLVTSFAAEQDRSISDVLKRMPGIEVEPSGRILYQGTPIQHFYVEGLDLMGGRYGLVSKNLPHKSVSTVEVMENHQPIKILEDRVPSYRTSINIKLKKDVTATGRAQLGSGLSPFLWDANITPMMFTKDFQVAGSYQANNTGKDVSRQLRALTMDNLRQIMEIELGKPSLLGIPALSPPGFEETRYLDNNIHLANANSLLRLSNDLQLRTNIHYIHDRQQQTGSTRRTIYTPGDTLTFDEIVYNKLQESYLKGEITLTRNVKERYLRNRLEFKTHWDKQSGDLTRHDVAMNQQLDNPFYDFSNRLNLIRPIGDKLVQFNSRLQYDQSPQQLKVSPGQFEELVSGGEGYDMTVQHIDLQRFNADHSFSFSSRVKRWAIKPELGFQYRQQWLDTETFVLNNDVLNPASTEFQNRSEGLKTRTYLNTELNYKRGNFTFTTDLPLSYLNIDIKDEELDKGQNISRFVYDPRLSLNYRFRGFWEARGSYRYSNRFGKMEDVYYGYIFKNHRTIQMNNAPLSESQNHNFSASIRYRNPIKAFFASAGYFYNISNNNLLYTNLIQSNGANVLEAIEEPNTSYSHNVYARASKFFSPIRSTFILGATYSRNQRKQLVNDNVFDAANNVYLLAPQLNVRFTEWLNAEYKANLMFYDTFHDGKKLNEVSAFRHFLNIYIFHAANQFFAIKGEYYQNKNEDNYFLDLQYRYTITKYRIDIDARWINIFNHSSYMDYYVGAFSLVENYYVLRPSQFLVSVRFNF